jgi:hypothetical protein
MIGLLAQTLPDVSLVTEVSKRWDLVGFFVALCVCIWKKILVPGWAYEALEKRLAEANEREQRAAKLGERLVEIQVRSMETAPLRRDA